MPRASRRSVTYRQPAWALGVVAGISLVAACGSRTALDGPAPAILDASNPRPDRPDIEVPACGRLVLSAAPTTLLGGRQWDCERPRVVARTGALGFDVVARCRDSWASQPVIYARGYRVGPSGTLEPEGEPTRLAGPPAGPAAAAASDRDLAICYVGGSMTANFRRITGRYAVGPASVVGTPTAYCLGLAAGTNGGDTTWLIAWASYADAFQVRASMGYFSADGRPLGPPEPALEGGPLTNDVAVTACAGGYAWAGIRQARDEVEVAFGRPSSRPRRRYLASPHGIRATPAVAPWPFDPEAVAVAWLEGHRHNISEPVIPRLEIVRPDGTRGAGSQLPQILDWARTPALATLTGGLVEVVVSVADDVPTRGDVSIYLIGPEGQPRGREVAISRHPIRGVNDISAAGLGNQALVAWNERGEWGGMDIVGVLVTCVD
jgi:hypothetical protein